MIEFFFENVNAIQAQEQRKKWIKNLIENEGKRLGKINYILCNDEYLIEVNRTYLQHDFYTDVITFDYCKGDLISGDIFLSLQRILDNASNLKTNKEEELNRVLAHGVLHLCGYKDKSAEEQKTMRAKEEYYLKKY